MSHTYFDCAFEYDEVNTIMKALRIYAFNYKKPKDAESILKLIEKNKGE